MYQVPVLLLLPHNTAALMNRTAPPNRDQNSLRKFRNSYQKNWESCILSCSTARAWPTMLAAVSTRPQWWISCWGSRASSLKSACLLELLACAKINDISTLHVASLAISVPQEMQQIAERSCSSTSVGKQIKKGLLWLMLIWCKMCVVKQRSC